MEKQLNFTDMEYSNRRRSTKREEFLKKMDRILPWKQWVAAIEPYYPQGKHSRPPQGIEVMLRMLLVQVWFNLSDEAVEDAILDSYAMKSFLGLDYAADEQVPDATTLCKFRKLLNEHALQKAIFDEVQNLLEKEGKQVRGGSIVDATIIEAPKLLREDDEVVYGDAGYCKLERYVTDGVERRYEINRQHGTFRRHSGDSLSWQKERVMENRKSSVRCKVEYAFHIVKDILHWRKVRYRGICKNLNYVYIAFASANLYMLSCVA